MAKESKETQSTIAASDTKDAPTSANAPASVASIKKNRKTYRTKDGGTIQSISKSDLHKRTPQNAVLVVCSTHHVPCGNPKSEGIFTRYYCPVEGCRFSFKLVKPTMADKMNERRKRADDRRGGEEEISAR
jgi:hypothetical protein